MRQHDSIRRVRRLVTTMAAIAIATATTAATAAADDVDVEAARFTADAVRAQGLPCAEPTSAQPDPAASKPDERVWILACGDARYRVQLMGDMPAKIERLQ